MGSVSPRGSDTYTFHPTPTRPQKKKTQTNKNNRHRLRFGHVSNVSLKSAWTSKDKHRGKQWKTHPLEHRVMGGCRREVSSAAPSSHLLGSLTHVAFPALSVASPSPPTYFEAIWSRLSLSEQHLEDWLWSLGSTRREIAKLQLAPRSAYLTDY